VPAEPIHLAFYDAQGTLINEYYSRPAGTKVEKSDDKHDLPRARARKGWNRFVWDMRVKPLPKVIGNDPVAGAVVYGPKVAPGSYTVKLTVAGQTHTQPLTIVKDAFADASQADMDAQFTMLMRIYNRMGDTIATINQMRDVRAQLDGMQKRLARNPQHAELAKEAAALRDRVLELEKQLQIPDLKPGWPGMMNHGTKLLAKLSGISDAVSVGNYRPTDQAVEVFNSLGEDIDEVFGSMHGLTSGDIAAFAKKVSAAGVGNVIV
jgi:hypothetical protein